MLAYIEARLRSACPPLSPKRKQEVSKTSKPAIHTLSVFQPKPKANGLLGELGFRVQADNASDANHSSEQNHPPSYSRLLQLGDIAFSQKVEQRKTQKRVIAFPKTGTKQAQRQ